MLPNQLQKSELQLCFLFLDEYKKKIVMPVCSQGSFKRTSLMLRGKIENV